METTLAGPRPRSARRARKYVPVVDLDHISIEHGLYQLAIGLRDLARQTAAKPKRSDVGARVHAAIVYAFCAHGGPLAMASRSAFYICVRTLARQLSITKAMAETVIKYLEGEIIERVAVDETAYGKHRDEKSGQWHNNAILWRFTKKAYMALLALHSASKRRAAKSDNCKSILHWKSIDVRNLPGRWIGLIRRKYPVLQLSGLTAAKRKTTRAKPAAPPSKVATAPVAPMSERLAAGLARIWSRVKTRPAEPVARQPSKPDETAPRMSAAEQALRRHRDRHQSVTQRLGVAVDDPRLMATISRVLGSTRTDRPGPASEPSGG